MKILVIIISSILLLMLGLILYVRYRSHNISDKKDLQTSLDKRINKFLETNKINGLVVGVYKNGRSSIKSFGNSRPDSASLFELASTSKLFTTSVLQILSDKGYINLNDKISDILKDKVKLPAVALNTTLNDLATHRSGFPSIPDSFIAKMTNEQNPYESLVIEDLYEYLATCKDKKEEGRYEYSNFGMGLLGHLLELKMNIKFEDLVKQELLSKLEMTQTTITLNENTNKLLIQGYSEAGDPNPVWIDNVLTGAGSFLSNANDMIKFIRANLDTSYSPVSNSLIKTHPSRMNGNMGIGWAEPTFIDNFLGNENIIWHIGMAGGYFSYLSIDRSTNSGLIILSNKAKDISFLGTTLTRVVCTQSWKE
jgi:serine-type D-Ala-D-Ala carboxypeptidase/endopeptidase